MRAGSGAQEEGEAEPHLLQPDPPNHHSGGQQGAHTVSQTLTKSSQNRQSCKDRTVEQGHQKSRRNGNKKVGEGSCSSKRC